MQKHAQYLALGALVVSGCGDSSPQDSSCFALEPIAVDPDGIRYQYKLASLDLPDDRDEALALAMDLDHDGRPDNALGIVLHMLFSAAENKEALDNEIRYRIEQSEILQLFEVTTTSLANARHVGFDAALGEWENGQLATTVERGTPLTGSIERSLLIADAGTIPLELSLPGIEEPFRLVLHAARIEAEVTEFGIAGRIGGVVTMGDVDRVLLPAALFAIERELKRDCDGTLCIKNSPGALFLDLFDADPVDGAITLDELRNSSFLQSLLAPDMNVFDEDGEPAVRCDDEKESLSLSLGFTAEPTVF